MDLVGGDALRVHLVDELRLLRRRKRAREADPEKAGIPVLEVDPPDVASEGLHRDGVVRRGEQPCSASQQRRVGTKLVLDRLQSDIGRV